MITSTPYVRTARRVRPAAAGAALLLLVTGCSAPVAPLEIGMNTRAVNLLLGERVTVVTQGPPPSVPVELPPPASAPELPPPPPPPSVELPPIDPMPDIEPPPEECPDAPPDAPYLNTATRTIELPPAPGKYEFSTQGGVFAFKPDPSQLPGSPLGVNVGVIPPTTTREVTNVDREGTGSYVFDVVTRMDVTDAKGKKSTKQSTAKFRIVPEWYPAKPPADPNSAGGTVEGGTGQDVPGDPTGAGIKPGFYLRNVDSGSDDSRKLPEPGLKLVDLPIQVGQSFHTAGTDGVTTMEYTSTVNRDRPRVDACGDLIDAFQIDLEGTISQKSQQSDEMVIGNFTASYAIAPQFGGLIVQEATEVTSDANGLPVAKRTLNATINSVPKKPKAPGGGG